MSVSEYHAFYESPLGRLTQSILHAKLVTAWGEAKNVRLAGFGFTDPYLKDICQTDMQLSMIPDGIGAQTTPLHPTCLVHDHHWPLPDASIDRLVVIHGLEETTKPKRLLREIWRVLTDDGLVIFVVPNRRGLWSLIETNPFAAGRPYSLRQLNSLLEESLFTATSHTTALHFPPMTSPFFLTIAKSWEKLGSRLRKWRAPLNWPHVAGVNLVEARKGAALPITGSKVDVLSPEIFAPQGVRALPTGQGRDKIKSAASEKRLARKA
ncbi:MAG: class I SAM-dependent methyltransferase [Pseudomonadota bacterium]